MIRRRKVTDYFASMQMFLLKKNKKLVNTNKYLYICSGNLQGASYKER